ncbi:SusC/RagA family TonB-linked outer membrane protein [Flavobacterium sp. 245]|uniref:SusC/RagA family TonB-linked outer membrane protein n=1 Tax=Flavobacterium sp. 245 TaxID=2512115 RepID=UPI0010611880|nr:SusC/RagA family TonB-linked outer membrane protein [Flavobacterium sp. 245]TDO96076.1 TonB-linked SusC/RagA family outer membrane protein [Flavobacterium sp. 245]
MNYFSFYKDGRALYCLIFLGMFFAFSSSIASTKRHFRFTPQQFQVNGTITDGASPLPGVTIAIKNRLNSAAISDYSGQYSITASPSDTLIVSFIGFKTAYIPVKGRKIVDVQLTYDTTTLQEVRVNAGYYSVKESERTGSIARITSQDIEIQPVTNVLATMQGRMAGVSITQTTGVPGGGFDIKIRGQNSLRSDANSPLYIVDGVPYASEAIGFNQTTTVFPTTTSPLNSINPDNIESIEVLKDADATSIYGSRGANGVVLITTKKGKAGKTVFNFSASTGAGKVTKFLDLMNTSQYLDIRRKAFINDGLTQYNEWDYDVNGTWDQNRYTNWQKELVGGTSQINDLQGTISGGSENTTFLLSGSYHTESTVFQGNFLYKKGGAQLSLNHHSQDNKFKMNFSAGFNSQNNDLPTSDFIYEARALPPNAPALYDSNGNLNWENGTWENPLRYLSAKFGSKTNDLIANTVISYELAQGLTAKANMGFTDLRTIETRTNPSTLFNPAYNITSKRSSIYVNNTDRSSWIIEPQLSYDRELGPGKLGVLLGSTFQSQTTTRLYQLGSGFSSNSLIYDLSAATTVRILKDDETDYKYQAFFGRVNYNLLEKYIINVTARRDGSSRFGPGNQFANFGAVGAAWLFSRENFLQDSSWLSFGKLRTSYGTTGNDQIGDYQYLDTYSITGVNYNGTIGLEPSRLFNADFGWETNKKLEAALELGFLKDRIFTTVAWYQNRSSNQLVGIPLPGTTGFTSLQSNLDATVENRGLELTLRTSNIETAHFKWSTNFNISFAKNRLVKFPGLESSTYRQSYRIGEPLNIRLLYNNLGVDPQTGVYKYEDVNKDGRISWPEDQQTVADLNPEYYGGLQNNLQYKRLTLDFLFQFVKQKNSSYPMGFAGQMSNQQVRKLNSWQQPGDNSPYPMYTQSYSSDAANSDYLFSDSNASIVDASFIRFKNISLTYDVPVSLKETQLKIMLQGQNLWTITRYEDGDPEFIKYGYLPPLKVITAGIQLIF